MEALKYKDERERCRNDKRYSTESLTLCDEPNIPQSVRRRLSKRKGTALYQSRLGSEIGRLSLALSNGVVIAPTDFFFPSAWEIFPRRDTFDLVLTIVMVHFDSLVVEGIKNERPLLSRPAH